MVFMNYITNWIANYKEQVVDKFFLKVSVTENIRHTVDHCVAFATKRKVKELGLDFSDPNWEENNFDKHDALFELPNHVYENGSINSLKLYSCSFVMPGLLNFKALKDVSLGWIEVTIFTLKTLLSTCKTIENLSLKKCWNLDHFDMSDQNLGLKRLVIDKCILVCGYFSFKAPNLKFFKYCGLVGNFEIDVQQDVMEEAEIDFSLISQYDEVGNKLYNLLRDLYPVSILTTDSFLLQVIPNGDESMRIQCDLNARHLIMKTQMHPHELCGFRFLLNSCPMLEKLTIEIDPHLIFLDYEAPCNVDLKNFWKGRQIVYQCLIGTLKVVEVKRFRGVKDEFFALRYLIQGGRVLEHININVLKDDQVEARRALAKKLLLSLSKASKSLHISIT